MGVTKATAILKSDDQIRDLSNFGYLQKSSTLCAVGKVEVTSSDKSGHVYRFCRVSSGARIHGMRIFSDVTGSKTFNIGVFNIMDTTREEGAVVNESLFATEMSLPEGIWNATPKIKDIEKRIWELLELTEDPMKFYDICIVGRKMDLGHGHLAVQVEYTI